MIKIAKGGLTSTDDGVVAFGESAIHDSHWDLLVNETVNIKKVTKTVAEKAIVSALRATDDRRRTTK